MSRVVKHEVDAIERVNVAHAIRIGERWFYSFGARGRVQTAWTLAGAKLYQAHELARALSRVTKAVERASKSKRVPVPRIESVVIGTRAAFPSDSARTLAVAGLGALLGSVVGSFARRGMDADDAHAHDTAARSVLGMPMLPLSVSVDRVPGPLAAGPGVSGVTRGASDAVTGVEMDSQPRDPDMLQGAPTGEDMHACARWPVCALSFGHDGLCSDGENAL